MVKIIIIIFSCIITFSTALLLINQKYSKYILFLLSLVVIFIFYLKLNNLELTLTISSSIKNKFMIFLIMSVVFS